MRIRFALQFLFLGSVLLPVSAGEPVAEAVFPDARLLDRISGVSADVVSPTTIEFVARSDSTLGLKVSPRDDDAGTSSGVSARLFGPAGEIVVTGTAADKSKAGKDAVKWKKVPLSADGDYRIEVSVTTAGGWLATLGGVISKRKAADSSDELLAPDVEASATIDGLPGDTLKWRLSPNGKKSKFKGQALRVMRPDGSSIPTDAVSKGSVVLDSAGEHTFVFTNVSAFSGAWGVKLTAKPRSETKRKGLVSALQTGLVPVVKSIDPDRGVHLDTAARITMFGRDFQPGMDVRITRKNRDDILATDFTLVSETEANFLLDLDTRVRDGETSVGGWTLSVWNMPLYSAEGDRSTLDLTSALGNQKKKFKSVSSGSVRLPPGVEDDTEVWALRFLDEFQPDLNRMGLGSDDPDVARLAREVVEAYVVAYLRDLFVLNETNGNVQDASAVPLSFVVEEITAIAGEAGVDFNRIDIGGREEDGDPHALDEPLLWGFAPLDLGNQTREDLSLFEADGVTRRGHGVRTRFLDPQSSDAGNNWVTNTAPLLGAPLRTSDLRYFTARFDPGVPNQAQRFALIVTQIERVAREIANAVAHQIGRAMGLLSNGDGPMAAPDKAGIEWKERDSLSFTGSDRSTLRANAVHSELPGKSDPLRVGFFPLIDQQALTMPTVETGRPYEAFWDFVGGRATAVPSDYSINYSNGSGVLAGSILNFTKLSANPPVCLDGNSCSNIGALNCGVLLFQLRVTDKVRDDTTFHLHRLKVVPDVSLVPPSLRPQAQTCRDEVLAIQ